MSIEDDLREYLSAHTAVPVYSRYLPPELPQCYGIQEIGGRTSNASIRRAVHFISVMAVSDRLETARQLLQYARDFFVENLPAEINGRHYYLAVAMAEGEILAKAARGPAYIYSVTLEVTVQL